MIADFDGVKITDNTKELDKADLLLKTAQNSHYIKEVHNLITPKELIEKLGLDSLKVIGVTGTNGKTTTAAAIYSLLNELGYKSALQGTRGFFVNMEQLQPKSLTTPSILETLYHMYLAKNKGCEYFVMEVSSHAIDQNRIEDLNFTLKVFTNLSQDHLDYHKTFKRYQAIKSSFFQDESLKLINKDDNSITYNPKSSRTYGIEEMATYKIAAYSLEQGISAVLQFGSSLFDFYSPLMGLFNLYNITAAIASVHLVTNGDLTKICKAVEEFGGVKGRMEVVSIDPLVIVDFAHTPDGMQKVFESFPGKKIVALFGAGGNRDQDKRAKMGAVASRFCTKIYLTSDNPRDEDPCKIIEDIAEGIKTDVNVVKIEDRKHAIKKALANLQKDEILLILGKGDEEYIEFKEKRVAHSDVRFIEELIFNI